MNNLQAISPIDGRYRRVTEALAQYFSEAALMRYRIIVEGEYFIALSEQGLGLPKLTDEEQKSIRAFYYNLSDEDAQIISDIETKGYKDIKATNHDVKAVEYFLKDKLSGTSLKDNLEWIHFALTSSDTNALAMALMISDAIGKVILPSLQDLHSKLNELAENYKNLPMLSRTHGQPASPTTFGKEFKVFSERLSRQIHQLQNYQTSAKFSGATGNFNAHNVAYPQVDWKAFSKQFIARFNSDRTIQIEYNPVATQIDNHDREAELADILRRINVILIGFDQDIWRYISDGWIVQKAVEGEVGSSTMPHKINPIKFENSEGNLGLANALFNFFATKLPISRLQRDLSDSTVERNLGVAFSHSLIGYEYLKQGLSRIAVDENKVKEELNNHPEVITEAYQTILRREGIEAPYEKLKEISRGKVLTLEDLHQFVDSLEVSEDIKKELKQITPENYIGIANKLV